MTTTDETNQNMETIRKKTAPRRRTKKLTAEKENKVKRVIVPQNKYIEAALKHQGSFIVYDPNFM